MGTQRQTIKRKGGILIGFSPKSDFLLESPLSVFAVSSIQIFYTENNKSMYFAEMQILFFLIGLGATSGRTLPGNRAKGSFVETPEFSSGLQAIEDFVEKYALSKCDKKQLDEVKEP